MVGALPILGAANVMMGIEPEHGATLPAMAAVLMEQIGIAVTHPAPAAAAATPPPTVATAASGTSQKAASKRPEPAGPAAGSGAASSSSSASADRFPTATGADKEQKVHELNDIRKLYVPKKALDTIGSRQADGEALPYEEVEQQAGLEVVTLPSEKDAPATAPGPVLGRWPNARGHNTRGGGRR